MDVINSVATTINNTIDTCTAYVYKNYTSLLILLVIGYYVRTNVMKKVSEGSGYTLSSSSSNNSTTTTTARSGTGGSRAEDMRQVRLRQQEIANERAIQAEKIRKEKEAKERDRKNYAAKKKHLAGGDKLGTGNSTSNDEGGSGGGSKDTTNKKSKGGSGNGTSSSSSGSTGGGYNPMNPWTSHSTGHRPGRRTIRRG